MNMRAAGVWIMAGVPIAALLAVPPGFSEQQRSDRSLSYEKDVAPIFRKHCLPCHAEESRNSSELSLDTHASMMEGGEHGTPIVPGKPDESILIQKLLPDPPFGDTMPLQRRRRSAGAGEKKITAEEVESLREWIRQGAKGN
ncbi:MAG TPA: c-type cytochrome domain-containing protein [Bacteroidota bacterium]|nr:c-type cytochrome domain-containing protein [Bacteroidota bacterium]